MTSASTAAFPNTAISPALPTMSPEAVCARLEEAALNATAVREQVLHDGWLVRGAPGPFRRMRCVNVIGASAGSLDRRLRFAQAWFAERQLPIQFRLTSICPDDTLDGELADRGFAAESETRVMAMSLTAPSADIVLNPVGRAFADARIEVLDAPAFAAAAGDMRGSSAADIAAHAGRLSGLAVAIDMVVLRDPAEQVIACGMAAREDDLVGIFDVVTHRAHRRQGAARRVVTALLSAARSRGAVRAYLQVEPDNVPARALYADYGFVDMYAYWYRSLPQANDAAPTAAP
ncbi:GNAT family N-acetyltransferase [Schauerella aestuarii]|uniref:GNAT family N-acetyltransferase n=1 Tax=Schauerella aestuarii TaxID=2511204 RepID=UPI00136C072E|nr:GNAT family N-acetyltransferase [Achromobacter aestuarii]MYZ41951.1 GNAT family N-acetyltransferase [Achromobacter aestuarii]